MEAIKIIDEENLAENAFAMGSYFRDEIAQHLNNKIIAVRGKGLLNAIAFDTSIDTTAFCHDLFHHGLLAKPTRNNAISFTPPLTISEDAMREALDIITQSIRGL